ncbi:MAG: leucine-rich repeat protein [Clostridia bacterium]|nr:leucine-rich repeat protein [Clostridia bacterium]
MKKTIILAAILLTMVLAALVSSVMLLFALLSSEDHETDSEASTSKAQLFETEEDTTQTEQASEALSESATEYVPIVEYTDGLILMTTGTVYSVVGYDGTSPHVVIPDVYMGIPVTAISSNAFKDCTVLETVVIPKSVVEIGRGAFEGCVNLHEAVFKNTEHWCYEEYKSSQYSVRIGEQFISNSFVAAKYLRETLCKYRWMAPK